MKNADLTNCEACNKECRDLVEHKIVKLCKLEEYHPKIRAVLEKGFYKDNGKASYYLWICKDCRRLWSDLKVSIDEILAWSDSYVKGA